MYSVKINDFGKIEKADREFLSSIGYTEERIKTLEIQKNIEKKEKYFRKKLFEHISAPCRDAGFHIRKKGDYEYDIARSYRDSKIYGEIAKQLTDWGERVLKYSEDVKEDVKNRKREMPSWEELEGELPKL